MIEDQSLFIDPSKFVISLGNINTIPSTNFPNYVGIPFNMYCTTFWEYDELFSLKSKRIFVHKRSRVKSKEITWYASIIKKKLIRLIQIRRQYMSGFWHKKDRIFRFFPSILFKCWNGSAETWFWASGRQLLLLTLPLNSTSSSRWKEIWKARVLLFKPRTMSRKPNYQDSFKMDEHLNKFFSANGEYFKSDLSCIWKKN